VPINARRPWLPAAAIASAFAAAYLVWQPWSADLAAHVFRAELFQRDGFTLWNAEWYGGHHTLGYSVLFPPLAALLGPRLVGALAAVAAAALFAALAREHFGERSWVGASWFAVGTATMLLSGRIPFALGFAFGLGALFAYQRGRSRWAPALAVASALASPVAALFVALAGVALAVGERRREGLGLAVAALAPVAVLVVLFPEGGDMPFVLTSYLPVLGITGARGARPARRRDPLRAGLHGRLPGQHSGGGQRRAPRGVGRRPSPRLRAVAAPSGGPRAPRGAAARLAVERGAEGHLR
jgi:hypothetical protein